MTDPIEGQYGALVLSGWVAAAPTGHDEAYLMVTTPDARAEMTMPLVAAGFGLTGKPGQMGTAEVELSDDGWATLVAAGERYPRPVNDEWAATATARRQVVLVVGTAPMPPGMDTETYTDRHGHDAVIGTVPP